ncbi:hypothetical protein HMPREF1320_0231 [Capnocytophaga sp. oral taxon 335 str. F0486]|nr:hypothetical protein HMPREF1320_0231 [Capnocytophaga sp. oral taxon 335 str. F0486]
MLQLIFALDSLYSHPFFVHCSSFVRLLFVLCSFFVRLLFVIPSSFVRFLFVFSPSARAARTVFCSGFIRLFSICPCGSHRLLFVLYSSFLHLPVWLAPSFVRSLFVFSPSARVARTRRIYFFTFHFSLFTFIRTFATQKYIIQNSKNV